MPVPIITYQIPMGQVKIEIDRLEHQLESDIVAGVEDVLKFIENVQIKAYTSTANPSLPSGSRYVRTFNLRDASETEITGTHLPNISGVWRVNEGKARYGPEVLGPRGQQKPIHRGRWKSQEDVEREAQQAAPGIVERHINQ